MGGGSKTTEVKLPEWLEAAAKGKVKVKVKPGPAQAKILKKARAEAEADAWLCPMKGSPGASAGPTVLDNSEEGYLALVDWTGRSLAKGKRGKIPPELRPIVENLHMESERWVETVAR